MPGPTPCLTTGTRWGRSWLGSCLSPSSLAWTSLDVVVAEEMKNLLRSLKDGRITIFSTHILDLALDLCDEIVLLSHGELEVVEKSNLDDHAFKEKIIAALKEESYA